MYEEGNMDCVSFWVWLASGVVIVPLIGFLKKLPSVGPIFEQWAWLLAPMLAAIFPQVATALTPYCAKIDPLLWSVIMAALAYLVSQIVYWVNKKTGASKALGL
jgi:hypothetical protein